MKLELTITQRLNISAVIGQQTGNAGEIFRFGSILDKVEISDDEKKEINLRAEGSIMFWDSDKAALAREVDLSGEDVSALSRVLKEWKNFAARDRDWLKPLLEAIG